MHRASQLGKRAREYITKAGPVHKQIFRKIFSEAVSYGLRRRLNYEQAEDFASRFIMARYVRRTDQKIDEAFIDYIRHEYGDIRTPGNQIKSKSMKTSIPVNPRTLGTYSLPARLILLKVAMEKDLKESDQVIINLKCQGYTLQQIANMLGKTAVAIHLRIKAIRLKLQNP